MRIALATLFSLVIATALQAQIQVNEAAFGKALRPLVLDLVLQPAKLVIPSTKADGFSACNKSLPGALSSRVQLADTNLAEFIYYQGPDFELASVWQNRLFDALRKTYPDLPTATTPADHQLTQTVWVERAHVSALFRPHPVHGFQALVRIAVTNQSY